LFQLLVLPGFGWIGLTPKSFRSGLIDTSRDPKADETPSQTRYGMLLISRWFEKLSTTLTMGCFACFPDVDDTTSNSGYRMIFISRWFEKLPTV